VKLVNEAGLAHAGLTDDRHHLPVTVACELLSPAKLLQFPVAADEAHQAASRGRLQAGPGDRQHERPPEGTARPGAPVHLT